MEVVVYRALLLFSLLLSTYGYIAHGLPGLITGLLIGTFLCFGLGGLVVTKHAFGGIGGIFLWFLGFVGFMMGLFLFERYVIDGGPIPGKTFGPPNGMYVADKAMVLFGKWVSFNSSPGDYTFMIVFFVAGFIISGLLSGKR
jgi:hypothetical protein